MSTIAFHPPAFAAPRAASPLRLTNRGRVVVFIVAVLAIGLLAVGFGSSTTATLDAGTPSATETVSVQSGETLWQIAVVANPNGDIRTTVDEIMEINSLPNAGALQMGRDIAVPIYTD